MFQALSKMNSDKGYIQSKSIMYDVFVLKEKAKPLKSLAKPISAFFASSEANIGPSAAVNKVPIFSNAAKKTQANIT